MTNNRWNTINFFQTQDQSNEEEIAQTHRHHRIRHGNLGQQGGDVVAVVAAKRLKAAEDGSKDGYDGCLV